MPVPIPVAPLLIQLPASDPGKATDIGSRGWVPVTQVGDPDEAPDFNPAQPRT